MRLPLRENLPPTPKRARGDAGFTILEVVIAAALLLIVFAGTLAALQTGFKIIDSARNTTLADQILQSQIEDIRLCSWVKLTALQTADAAASPTGSVTLDDGLGSQFKVIRKITDIRSDALGNVNMRRLNLTVSWNNSITGKLSTRSYQSVYTQNGLTDYFVTSRP